MIHLGAALLCDAATVRDNLVSVLGGGLTQLRRSGFPAPLGADIALTFYVDPSDEADHSVAAECRLLTQSEPVFRVEAGFQAMRPVQVGPASVSIFVPATNFGLPSAGPYEITVTVDNEPMAKIPFVAVLDSEGWPAPAPPAPTAD